MDVKTSENLDVNFKESTGHIRTRKELSLKEKLDILKLYDELPKMSQRSAAIRLKISQPVLCKILKNRSFIENITLTKENSVRKRTRGGKDREVESALKLWYVDVQKKNIPINGQIIRRKAKELAKQMGKEFAATDGWFSRWRKRENIVYNSLLRRKFKSEKECDCFQNEADLNEDDKQWVEVPENHDAYNDSEGRNSKEASKEYKCESLDYKVPVKICSESKMLDLEGSKKWETETGSICQVFIKSEPIFEEELHIEENPPTDEEMLNALNILDAGVKHRANDLQLHYEYQDFIYQLLCDKK